VGTRDKLVAVTIEFVSCGNPAANERNSEKPDGERGTPKGSRERGGPHPTHRAG